MTPSNNATSPRMLVAMNGDSYIFAKETNNTETFLRTRPAVTNEGFLKSCEGTDEEHKEQYEE